MFFELARILRAKQPRLFVFENVKGLLSHDNGQTFRTIIATLDELGYDLQWQVLNSNNYTPQRRERIYILGHKRGHERPEVFPTTQFAGSHLKEVTSGVSDAQRIYNPTGSARTLKALGGGQGAKTGMYMFPEGVRMATQAECERLQGFPDRWTEGVSDSQRYKCLGNAVTVNVIEDIMEKLL